MKFQEPHHKREWLEYAKQLRGEHPSLFEEES